MSLGRVRRWLDGPDVPVVSFASPKSGVGKTTLTASTAVALHHDEAVAEAVACQTTVLDYAPGSVATQDILTLAQRVHRTLTAG